MRSWCPPSPPPHVVVVFGASLIDAEVEKNEEGHKARKLLERFFRTQGLIGLPIWTSGDGSGAEHWTLLVLRRHGQSEIQVRYYDSAATLNPIQLVAGARYLRFPDDHGEAGQAQSFETNWRYIVWLVLPPLLGSGGQDILWSGLACRVSYECE